MKRRSTAKKTEAMLLINLRALRDIPTASFVKGARGETIVNGGLGPTWAIVGKGNNYKTTLMDDCSFTALSHIRETHDTYGEQYDTEVNVEIFKKNERASTYPNMGDNPVFEDESFIITDKTKVTSDAWYREQKDYFAEKMKDTKNMAKYTAFKDPYTKKPLVKLLPTLVSIDSLSEFEDSRTMKMLEDKDLEDGKDNMMFARLSLFKTKVLSEVPRLAAKSNTLFLATAHVVEKNDYSGNPRAFPSKSLQFLKHNEKIKGVSNNFFFLLTSAWYAHTASVLINKTDKLPEFPRNSDDLSETDLNTVKLTNLRNKTGPSGFTIEMLVSQTEGLQHALTEFYFLKTNRHKPRFGIGGDKTNFYMELLPNVKLNRKKLRTKIRENPKLDRVMQITAEMLQLSIFHPAYVEKRMCTPKELYEDLLEKGYDWDLLLDSRPQWLIDQYNKKSKPYLSTIDLLDMRQGDYVPYWYEEKLKEKNETRK